MIRIAVTGANGLIGRALVEALNGADYEVVKLTRGSVAGDMEQPWRLGEPLPHACEDVDVVVHLACATLGNPKSMREAAELDVSGTGVLLESIRQLRRMGRRTRFIFVSSQSASPGAANQYGRSKWAIEAMLGDRDEIIVRPGLVYCHPASGVFGLFEKLAALPVVPVVTSKANIQPIHVSELAQCIVQIATMEAAPRLFQLGAIQPMTFKEAIVATARRAGRTSPMAVPLPTALVRVAVLGVDRALGLVPSLVERLDGLTALEAMETAPSLNVLRKQLAPF